LKPEHIHAHVQEFTRRSDHIVLQRCRRSVNRRIRHGRRNWIGQWSKRGLEPCGARYAHTRGAVESDTSIAGDANPCIATESHTGLNADADECEHSRPDASEYVHPDARHERAAESERSTARRRVAIPGDAAEHCGWRWAAERRAVTLCSADWHS
jgi:hypothetical protein